MKTDLNDFKTGWFGIQIGLKAHEIGDLIDALEGLKKYRTHFHLRSEFKGEGGVGDIEIYIQPDDQPSNMEIEASVEPQEL